MTDSDATVDYLDVLILCSSPIDLTPNLNLDQELATFENEVRSATIPIRLKRVYPPTYQQLERELSPRALHAFRPRVFHFLGHGEEDGLWFETERSTKKLVSPNELRRLLARDGSPLELALLNACWSGTGRVKSICQYLIEDSPIRAAIGHAKPVADESAIRFSQRFYEMLIDGHPLRSAFNTAANAIAEAGLPGFNEVTLEGDGELCPGQDLSDGERTGQVLTNLPEDYSLPAADFFCGRAEEFAAAVAALEDNQLTGFGIWGIGGMGKTALAKELARRCAWRYRGGGVAFVDIRDLPEPDRTVTGLLQRVRSHLDRASNLPDPAMSLVRYLDQAGAALIVLDNLEDLPEAEHDALARFVRDLPRNGSKVTITARTRVGPFDQLPTTRSLELTRGLDDYNGAHYVYWVGAPFNGTSDCHGRATPEQRRED